MSPHTPRYQRDATHYDPGLAGRGLRITALCCTRSKNDTAPNLAVKAIIFMYPSYLNSTHVYLRNGSLQHEGILPAFYVSTGNIALHATRFMTT